MRRGQGNDLLAYSGTLLHESDAAWLVQLWGIPGLAEREDEGRVWFPKSQCELEHEGTTTGCVVRCPEWLARKKDLC